nr:hypothetical protein [Tanacetum cinerariifolium]
MSDSDESGVTYTDISSPFEELSDIGSPRADDHEHLELPEMLEDPYVEVALQVPPSPDYIPALRSQSRHHPRQIIHSSIPPAQQYQSHQTSYVPPIAYNSPQCSTQPLIEFPQMDSGLVVPVFNQGDDPIMCLNKAMAFLIAVASSSQHAASHVIDDEETLIAEEVSRSKILAKQNDPMSKEKKVNTTLINYVELNRLSEYSGKCFVPQQKMSDEQAFRLQTLRPNTNQSASSPVKIEASKELLKVSLVNTSLRKLKYHLGQFNTVVKKRITPDAITEGEWGFGHTKAVFLKEIIPFLKNLNDIFNVFDKDLLNEDVLLSVMNSTTLNGESVNPNMQRSESCDKCVDLDIELFKSQNTYNDLSKSYSQLEKHCISLEFTMQLNQEIFEKDSFSNNRNALEIPKYFENNNLKAQLQAKDTTIYKLKEHIKSMRENDKEEKVKYEMDEIETINIKLEHNVAKLLYENKRLHKEIKLKGKHVLDNATTITYATIIAPGMFKLDIEPLSHRLKNNRDAHEDYLKKTIENTNTIHGLTSPSFTKPSKKLVAVTPMIKVKKVRSQPTSNKKNDRISQSPSSNIKNKVEVQRRRVKSKSNKKNRVKDPICNTNVRHTMLNVNSELICVKCKQCMLDANHDMCFLDFINDVNVHSKSKSDKKSQQHNIWKPTGKVFTDVRYKWKPTGRLFTKFGNSCPLTRITPTKVVHLKGTASNSGYPDCSLVSGLRKLKTYDKESLLAHELRSRDINLYTISLDDMLKYSPICLLSKASKTNSWLWHHQLSHLKFGTLNKLAKDGLARGIPKLKIQKDHLCSASALGKSKKSSHQPKAEDTNEEKLYLLHIDLCGLMRVESIDSRLLHPFNSKIIQTIYKYTI